VISSLKTVLVADDEYAVRRFLQEGLALHLPDFEVATVADGQEAIDFLTSHPVDVVVTDIAMPVKDGFAVLAHLRNHHPNVPVVVLTAADAETIERNAPRLGMLRVVQKPATAAQVARHVLDARAETARGRMSGMPLTTLLQLLQRERKSCSLYVRSGERRGRLHFRSGELVNAYAFELDQEGEAAARYLLALDDVTIDFERSLHNHLRRIHTPLEALLLDIARERDERSRDAQAAVAAAAMMAVRSLASRPAPRWRRRPTNCTPRSPTSGAGRRTSRTRSTPRRPRWRTPRARWPRRTGRPPRPRNGGSRPPSTTSRRSPGGWPRPRTRWAIPANDTALERWPKTHAGRP